MWRSNAARGHSLAVATVRISVVWLVLARVGVADDLQKETSPRAASEKALQALATSTTVKFIDLPLTDALRSLAKYHNIVINVDGKALESAKIVPDDAPVFLQIDGVSLRSLLSLLLEPKSLGYIVDGDELIVTTRELADAYIEEANYDLHDAARAGVSPADLGEVIVQTFDPGRWQGQGGTGRLRVEETRLVVRQRADVQRRVQQLLGDLERALVAVAGAFEDDQLEQVAYSIADLRKGVSDADLGNWLRESLLVATSPETLGRADLKIEGDQMRLKQTPWVHGAVAKYFATVRNRGKAEPARPRTQEDFAFVKNGLRSEALRRTIRKQLAKPISVDFLDLPAEDALVFVKEAGGVNLGWMINRAEARKRGVNFDAPVTLKAAHERLATVLDKILTGMALDWHVAEPGLIVVAPPLEGAAALQPRVYGVQELRDRGHTVDDLVSSVTNLDPGSWAAAGGLGSVQPLSPGLLIVNQTRSVHDQIDKLFEKLAPVPKKSTK